MFDATSLPDDRQHRVRFDVLLDLGRLQAGPAADLVDVELAGVQLLTAHRRHHAYRVLVDAADQLVQQAEVDEISANRRDAINISGIGITG